MGLHPLDPPERRRACPICGGSAVARYHPFCSARCADLDLHRWLSGQYAIAAEEEPEPDSSNPAPRDEDG